MALVPIAGFALVAGIGNSAIDSGQKDLAAGRIASAESQARKAQTWAPWSAEPWSLLAKANLAAGHRQAAVKELETATKKDPRDFRLWFELAFAARGEAHHEAVLRTRKLNPNIHKFPTS